MDTGMDAVPVDVAAAVEIEAVEVVDVTTRIMAGLPFPTPPVTTTRLETMGIQLNQRPQRRTWPPRPILASNLISNTLRIHHPISLRSPFHNLRVRPPTNRCQDIITPILATPLPTLHHPQRHTLLGSPHTSMHLRLRTPWWWAPCPGAPKFRLLQARTG